MKKGMYLLLVAMLVLGMLQLVLQQEDSNVKAGTPDDGIDGLQYVEGNWLVSGPENYTDEIIVLNGSLTVFSGGILTLRNVTLMMNCTSNGQYRIEVRNYGSLIITDKDGDYTTTDDASNITDSPDDTDDESADGVSDFRYKFIVYQFGEFKMNNSILRECGYSGATHDSGFILDSTTGVTIENCTIKNCYRGFINYGSKDTIFRNNVISDCYIGLYQMTKSFEPDGGEIVNNRIFNCTSIAISFQSGRNFDVSDNVVYNCPYGVMIIGGLSNSIYDNEIYSCVEPFRLGGSSLVIWDNYVHNNSNSGSQKQCVNLQSLRSSQFFNNTIENYTVTGSSQCTSLQVYSSSNLELFNNTIQSFTAPDSNSYAVYVSSSYNINIHDNHINDIDSGGIQVRSDSSSETNFFVDHNEIWDIARNDCIYLYSPNIANNPYFEVKHNDIYDFGGAISANGMRLSGLGNYRIVNNNITSSLSNSRGIYIYDSVSDDFSNNTIDTVIQHFFMMGNPTNNFTVINTTCDMGSYYMQVDGMEISFGYHLQVNTSDVSGPTPRVNVTVKNGTGQIVYEGKSALDGKVRYIPLINRTILKSGGSYITTYFDPHNITGEFQGNMGYCAYEPTMNKTQSIDLYFNANLKPFPATNLAVESYMLDVNLTWDATISPDLDHYKIYRKGSVGGWAEIYNTSWDPPTKTRTNWTDLNGASDWSTYWYKVVAVDTGGLHADDSNTDMCGDWIITSTQTVENQVIQMNGSIYVYQPTELTIKNTTITFNCISSLDYGIQVEEGCKLNITDADNNPLTEDDRSIFKPVNIINKFFFKMYGSDYSIKNSRFSGCGLFDITSTNITIEYNEFDNNSKAIYLNGLSNAYIDGN
ncbi:MAG: right-handed parallel beta-helix repeat-containing protein, partial [Methanomassiliicoccales archaeon]